jgi:hypothetical protein
MIATHVHQEVLCLHGVLMFCFRAAYAVVFCTTWFADAWMLVLLLVLAGDAVWCYACAVPCQLEFASLCLHGVLSFCFLAILPNCLQATLWWSSCVRCVL